MACCLEKLEDGSALKSRALALLLALLLFLADVSLFVYCALAEVGGWIGRTLLGLGAIRDGPDRCCCR